MRGVLVSEGRAALKRLRAALWPDMSRRCADESRLDALLFAIGLMTERLHLGRMRSLSRLIIERDSEIDRLKEELKGYTDQPCARELHFALTDVYSAAVSILRDAAHWQSPPRELDYLRTAVDRASCEVSLWRW